MEILPGKDLQFSTPFGNCTYCPFQSVSLMESDPESDNTCMGNSIIFFSGFAKSVQRGL